VPVGIKILNLIYRYNPLYTKVKTLKKFSKP